MPQLTIWYEFASTYSYLSAIRIAPLCAQAGVRLIWRPFLLGPIFAAQGWNSSPFNLYPAKGRYMWHDLSRQAAALGLPPITRPDPFPQNGLLAARIATLGADQPWGPDFTRATFHAQFAKGADISAPQTLADILKSLGQIPDQTLTQAQSTPIKSALRQATETAQQLGLFGAPSFTTMDNELFWGDDRLEHAIAAALSPNTASF